MAQDIPAALIAQKNTLADASGWLVLYQIDVDDFTAFYLVGNPDPVTFDGNEYLPFPIQHGPITEDTKGDLHEMSITVSNISRELLPLMEASNGFLGRELTMRIIHRANLSDPAAVIEQKFQITGANVSDLAIDFRLSHRDLMLIKLPPNRYNRNRCRWVYKSVECGYVDAIADCDKTLEGTNGCRFHDNQIRYGGFPAIPRII